MQSIFGALFTAGYAAAAGAAISASGKNVSGSIEGELTKSFSSAADLAKRYPESVQHQIIAAREGLVPERGSVGLHGRASSRSLLGAVLVFFMFPKGEQEKRLLAEYQSEDAAPASQIVEVSSVT